MIRSRSGHGEHSTSRLWGAIRGGVLALLLVPALVALPAGLAAPRVAHAAPAAPATSADVLILDTTVTGGANSLEAQAAQALGLTVEVDDATAWAAKTTADFASYKAIVFGDPTCSEPADPYLAPAEANPSVWGPAVTGNVVIIGTDPVYHAPAQPGAKTLIQDGIAYAASHVRHTGAYIDLSCYYASAPSGTDVPVLDAISSPGAFTVVGQGGCPNAAHIVAAAPPLASLTDAALSNWNCSTHEGFVTWPASYTVLAIDSDIPSSYVASDGTSGAPYILANLSGVTGATNGPTGTARLGGGNPSQLGYCVQSCGQPIDTYSGNFYHAFDDLAVAGRGVPLDFTRMYNAQAASQPGPLGFGWTDSYNLTLAVDSTTGNATITQENGSTVTFTPGSSGSFTAPAHVLATLVHNSDGTYTFTRIQGQLRFTFNASGQLIAESDRNGYVTTLTYGGNNLLSTVTDPAGRALTLAYDSNERITAVTDPIGRQVSFAYDTHGNLVAATDVAGGVTKFTYDTNHLLLTMTDPRGGVLTNVYDGSARVVSQTDAMGRATTLSYDTVGGTETTTITDPNGNVLIEEYQNALRVLETRGSGTALAATWTYTYDPVSLGLASTTDPNGNTWTATWDAAGNLLTSTDPLGRTTTYTYDVQNDVTSATDPLGVTTTYTYDTSGNLLGIARPLSGTSQTQTVTLIYGDTVHPGDVTAMTDPDGQRWAFAYDANGDRVRASDPLGDTTTSQYNGIGWETAEVAPNGNVTGGSPAAFTTSYTRDNFGDVLVVTDPLGHKTSAQYDANRNVIETIDAAGHVTKNVYDADDELTQVTRPDGSVLGYAYDTNGNQISQTDGLGHLTAYAYDALDRLTSTADPLGRITSYGYDGAGNTTSLTDAASRVTTYSYDAANELTGIAYSDGKTPNVTYTYDQDGRRAGMADGTGTTTYTYDSLNRLTASTNGAGQRVGYGYDLLGNLTSLTYPGGTTVARGYDAADRLTSVTDWLGHTTSFAYDANGNLTREGYPNGITAEFSYDRDDGVTGIADSRAGTRLLGLGYTRNALEQLASTTQSLSPTQQSYQYTALNQLSTAGTTPYQYDHGDNLIRAGDATLAYDAADEVTSLVRGGVTTAYSYDANGNRTQAKHGADAPATYAYDQENRLIGYASATTSATYTYDGDGLRASKTVGGKKTSFTWDVAEGLPLLLADGATRYVYGPSGMPLEQVTPTDQVLYFHQDQLGSTRALSNPAGALVATYTYDAYGNVTSHTGTAATPLQFAGQYTDAETGLLYLSARYYDPTTCQFISEDPLLPITQQAYGYAEGDPLNAVDPSGMGGLGSFFARAWHGVQHATRWVSTQVGRGATWVGTQISRGASWAGTQISRGASWAINNSGNISLGCSAAALGFVVAAGATSPTGVGAAVAGGIALGLGLCGTVFGAISAFDEISHGQFVQGYWDLGLSLLPAGLGRLARVARLGRLSSWILRAKKGLDWFSNLQTLWTLGQKVGGALQSSSSGCS